MQSAIKATKKLNRHSDNNRVILVTTEKLQLHSLWSSIPNQNSHHNLEESVGTANRVFDPSSEV